MTVAGKGGEGPGRVRTVGTETVGLGPGTERRLSPRPALRVGRSALVYKGTSRAGAGGGVADTADWNRLVPEPTPTPAPMLSRTPAPGPAPTLSDGVGAIAAAENKGGTVASMGAWQ